MMLYTVNGAPAYCYTAGKPFDPAKPTVVFIHGVLCDHSVWALQSRYLAEARRDKSSRISAINESLGTFRAENKFAIAARRQQTPDSPLRVGGLA